MNLRLVLKPEVLAFAHTMDSISLKNLNLLKKMYFYFQSYFYFIGNLKETF